MSGPGPYQELADDEVPFLADILPTAREAGIRSGMAPPHDTVAIAGAGAVGLAASPTVRPLHAGARRADRPGRSATRAGARTRASTNGERQDALAGL